jgi:hypothetical protein
MHNQLQDRTAELKKKFPGVKAALKALRPEGSDSSKDSIYISVERIDRSLLSNVPQLCSGNGASLIDPDQPGLIGWQHDLFYAVGSEHQLLGHIGAVRPEEDLRDARPVKHLVLTHRKELSYLVRLTITGWCHPLDKSSNEDNYMGELQRRDIAVTVYREPDEGFDDLLSRVWTDANLRMHFGFFGLSTKNPDVRYFFSCLTPIIQEFEQRTFFNGFFDSLPTRNHLAEQEGKQAEGMLDDVAYSASTWEDNGRKVNVYLTRGDVKIGFFYHQKEQKSGYDPGLQIAGMDGTLEEVRALLDTANRGWMTRLVGKDKLEEVKNLWDAAVSHYSTDYLLRLTDPAFDLRSAVSGIRTKAQDGDLYMVEVPVESDEDFNRLWQQGVVVETTTEQTIRLLELYVESEQRKLDSRWDVTDPIQKALNRQMLERTRQKIAELRADL